MIEVMGQRQQELLRLLLRTKSGMTVDELSRKLEVTRNAVRQHLASLENDGLIEPGISRPSGGRPEQLYVLSDKGMEIFPRQYSWFAELVIDSIRDEAGEGELNERLGRMGERIADKLLAQNAEESDPQKKVEKLAEIMQQMGYNTGGASVVDGQPVIEADNCVFHNLAMKNPDICRFDLAMMSKFTGSKIDHQECMALGGNVCRFKFSKPSKKKSGKS
ncbi:MAG TPA: HTH domain-containing protein [Dokdonella sp.]|uniref:helix-turn-helix transcriptional regulator n=1 Tax=Dokdonella sp. TaxID=2291710 RepID=UPI002D80F45C|nr:HTH domain-containing protein [Dokdonella sp.]HET9031471.1 HTH domain-containing protein [Dokdonella sp.]